MYNYAQVRFAAYENEPVWFKKKGRKLLVSVPSLIAAVKKKHEAQSGNRNPPRSAPVDPVSERKQSIDHADPCPGYVAFPFLKGPPRPRLPLGYDYLHCAIENGQATSGILRGIGSKMPVWAALRYLPCSDNVMEHFLDNSSRYFLASTSTLDLKEQETLLALFQCIINRDFTEDIFRLLDHANRGAVQGPMSTRRSNRRPPRDTGRAKRRRKAVRHEDFIMGELSPEHDSVEPVRDADEDAAAADDYMGRDSNVDKTDRRRAKKKPLRPRLQIDDDEGDYVQGRKRPKASRLNYDADDDDDDDADDQGDREEEEEEQDDSDDVPDPELPLVETVSLDEVNTALDMNIKHLNALRDLAMYYRGPAHAPRDYAPLLRVEKAMLDTVDAMQDWMLPVRQAGPIEHSVPPSIPEADGSEKRFTEVAGGLGIHWSAVSAEDKARVYERALELHVQHYGCRPRKVRMWTNDGLQPVYYYSEVTYRKTMLQALIEYQERPPLAGPQPPPPLDDAGVQLAHQ